jgi:hypothetical protein
MGAVPEFAPMGQDHLLRSSSVVRKVKYGKRSIEYETFDKSATEVFRLSFKPGRIAAGKALLGERGDLNQDGYTIRQLTGGDYELRLHHRESSEIRITEQ